MLVNRKEVAVSTLEYMDSLIEVQKMLCSVSKRNFTDCPMRIANEPETNSCAIIRTIKFLRDNI